ncbi:HAD-superfamily phosphatase, subfamily IIIC:FkbH [Mycobacterium montefiorense]|nr:HAD-IIIC family phosphatase [Mycobacterium montefiorense]GLE52458.1 HAD-superfamily phosphatase, subfamily IIIC:FkbH [Mycobacterium montefiorense]
MTHDPVAIARALRNSPPVVGRQALASSFTEIASLLTDADDDTLLRTGVVLKHLSLTDIPTSVPAARIAVIGTSTLGLLEAPLLGALAARGIAAQIEFGDFGGMIAELLDPNCQMLHDDPTAVILLPDGEAAFRYSPVPFTVETAVAGINAFVDELISAINSFRARSSTPIVVPTLLLPMEKSLLLLDIPSRARLAIAWNSANLRLLEVGTSVAGVVVVDMNQLAAYAPGTATDPRLAAYARSYFTEIVLLSYARQVAAVVAASLGCTSKCLVLDLDGTIWGGVLADDGPLGVVSGEGRTGEAFAALQDAARQLSSQGVVLAIASKNDYEAVQSALTDHPGVRVGVEDFAVIVANWHPKPDNIARIAEILNVGLESLVFVDDNASERGAVLTSHPQIRTVAADVVDPARTLPNLLRDGAFTSLRLTDDDRQRSQRYRAEAERVNFRQSLSSVDDYLAGLETEVTIAPAGHEDIDRLSQLTLRTNQYNLTTIRLDPDAVKDLLARPQSIVKTVRCSDKFSDHGLVAALFAEIDHDRLKIMNFVMSCRVLGRGIEVAALHAVIEESIGRGACSAVGTFVRTAKNKRAVDFFSCSGFVADAASANNLDRVGAVTTFHRSLSTVLDPASHLTVNISQEIL